jgi:hypothetical protein
MASQLRIEFRDGEERNGLDPLPTFSQQGSPGRQFEFVDNNQRTTIEFDEETIGRTKEHMAAQMELDSTKEIFNEQIGLTREPFENMSHADVRKDLLDNSALRAGTNQSDDGSEQSSHAHGSDEQSIIIRPRPYENLLHGGVMRGSMKIAPRQAGANESGHRREESSYHDKVTESTIKSTSPSRDISVRELNPKLAAFERRAGSPTLRSAYDHNHESSQYTDLAEPDPANAHEKRLEAMHARKAEENYHDRIPPEDAPRHMQAMVILYQWAAWATEISNPKRREEMTKWVNGRFLDFLMMGGHVPGYNLKELLQLAGVDPKELYGHSSGLVEQRPMADMSSSQLAAAITGKQPNPTKTEHDAAENEKIGTEFDPDGMALDVDMNAQPTNIKVRDIIRIYGDDDDDDHPEKKGRVQFDNNLDTSSPSAEDDSGNRHEPSSSGASGMLHESPLTPVSVGKRGATSDDENSQQVCLLYLLLVRAVSSKNMVEGR